MALVRKPSGDGKIPIDMTPMIDIVFQLLTFFIMTLRVSAQEGDFNIKMPLSAPRAGNPPPDLVPPIKIRLTARDDGGCNEIVVNDARYAGSEWDALRQKIATLAGGGDSALAASMEVELDCDYNLRYENVIRAITSVSGQRDQAGNIVKYVEKIKFAPIRPAN